MKACSKCGLLRSPCNSALGLLGDDVNTVIAAATYLLSYQPSEEALQ